jgi:dTDP-4-dehydrorhamnose 3,5-epimerase
MKITKTPLKDCALIEPKFFGDSRGFFFESYNETRYSEVLPAGTRFVQDNVSRSTKGVLRGLHFQNPGSQGKLVQVLEGSVWDVVVDLRRSSPTFGKHFGVELSQSNHLQMWVPHGFAHGFCVISESALFAYKVTSDYLPDKEWTLLYNDPALEIQWPNMGAYSLSPKDQMGWTLDWLIQNGKVF